MSRERIAIVSSEPEASAAANVQCAHHWLIEPAKGPTSVGVCKLCGEVREFSNQFRSNGLLAAVQPDLGEAPDPDAATGEKS
jgi:hypothetical protein